MNFHTAAIVVSLLTLCLHESGSLSGELPKPVHPFSVPSPDVAAETDLPPQKNTRPKRFIKLILKKTLAVVKIMTVKIIKVVGNIIKFIGKILFGKLIRVIKGIVKGVHTTVTGMYRSFKHSGEKTTSKLTHPSRKYSKETDKFGPIYVQIASLDSKSLSKSSKTLQQLLKEMASGSKSISAMGKTKTGDVETNPSDFRLVTGKEKVTLQKLLEAPANLSRCGTLKGMTFFALGDYCVAHLGGGLFGITPASDFQLLSDV